MKSAKLNCVLGYRKFSDFFSFWIIVVKVADALTIETTFLKEYRVSLLPQMPSQKTLFFFWQVVTLTLFNFSIASYII